MAGEPRATNASGTATAATHTSYPQELPSLIVPKGSTKSLQDFTLRHEQQFRQLWKTVRINAQRINASDSTLPPLPRNLPSPDPSQGSAAALQRRDYLLHALDKIRVFLDDKDAQHREAVEKNRLLSMEARENILWWYGEVQERYSSARKNIESYKGGYVPAQVRSYWEAQLIHQMAYSLKSAIDYTNETNYAINELARQTGMTQPKLADIKAQATSKERPPEKVRQYVLDTYRDPRDHRIAFGYSWDKDNTGTTQGIAELVRHQDTRPDIMLTDRIADQKLIDDFDRTGDFAPIQKYLDATRGRADDPMWSSKVQMASQLVGTDGTENLAKTQGAKDNTDWKTLFETAREKHVPIRVLDPGSDPQKPQLRRFGDLGPATSAQTLKHFTEADPSGKAFVIRVEADPGKSPLLDKFAGIRYSLDPIPHNPFSGEPTMQIMHSGNVSITAEEQRPSAAGTADW